MSDTTNNTHNLKGKIEIVNEFSVIKQQRFILGGLIHAMKVLGNKESEQEYRRRLAELD